MKTSWFAAMLLCVFGTNLLAAKTESVAAGGAHTCAVIDGDVWCRGSNSKGQLGDGTTKDHFTPSKVSVVSGKFKEVSAGAEHSCALTTQGAVWCWGANTNGQVCGDCIPQSTGPNVKGFPVKGLESGVKHIYANGLQSIALKKGKLLLWGRATWLDTPATKVAGTSLKELKGESDFINLVPSGNPINNSICATESTGKSSCWGNSPGKDPIPTATKFTRHYDFQCALGKNGVLACTDGEKSMEVKDVSDFSESPYHYVCMKTKDAQVLCWGRYSNFALRGTFESVNVDPPSAPLLADDTPLKNVSILSVGETHACAIAESKVYCWGSNTSGQLGVTSRTVLTFPEKPRSVHAGRQASCAIHGGGASCWGNGFDGAKPRFIPLDDVSQVVAGEKLFCHSSKENVTCTGPDAWRQPGSLEGSRTITSLAGAEQAACAIDGEKIWCWGGVHQQGFGRSPKMISALKGASRLSMSQSGACVVADGNAWCWSHFQEDEPTKKKLEAKAVDVAIGETNACAVLVDGKVMCWEQGREGKQGSASQVSLPEKAKRIAMGIQSACALTEGKKVYCWGNNSDYEVAPGISGWTAPVLALEGVVDLSLTFQHACALKENGEVACWGSNANGELGSSPASFVARQVMF